MVSWSGSPHELLGCLNRHERRVAPDRLYCRGRRALLDVGTRMAVVGSRRATAKGLAEVRLASTANADA